MKIARPLGWIVFGIVVGVVASRAFGVASAAQAPYKVIQAPRDAVSLEATLNSNATQGWRLKAIDGGLVVLER
jgi:hypothetical protein